MKLKYISLMMIAALASSCNDDFLERYPQDQVTDKNFWQSEAHVRDAANGFTRSLMGKDWLNMTESFSDLTVWYKKENYSILASGNYTPDEKRLDRMWQKCYENIGRVNYFLDNYHRAVTVSDAVKERFAAEAYFYRAFNYWVLISYFGDVPYITTTLNTSSPDVYRGRDKVNFIVEQMTSDIENTYQNLPKDIKAGSDEFGHVSQTAAMALLSRIYLYNAMYRQKYTDNAEHGENYLTSQDLFRKSVSAAERAMQTDYYCIYNTGHPDRDYMNLFNYAGRASRQVENRETLLAYVYNYDLGTSSRNSHNLSRELWVPNGSARFIPTNSAVELYLNADGSEWNPASAKSYEEIFKNRDPRLSQTILPPSTPWCGGKDGDKNNENRDLFLYPRFNFSSEGCHTVSGFYMRKYVEPSIVPMVGHDDNDIILLRYAEVLLNYAEAKLELGELTQDILNRTVNLLRDRVGMVHMTMGGDMRAQIQRERSVELIFEGHRYFDLKRWGRGKELANDILGVRRDAIDETRLEENALKSLNWTEHNGAQYLLIETDRVFVEGKHEFLSLPFAQMVLNPNLRPNNPGWM